MSSAILLQRLRSELTKHALGEKISQIARFDDGNWVAYFESELGALRVYAAYGGGNYFGPQIPVLVEEGSMAGTYMLTTAPGKS